MERHDLDVLSLLAGMLFVAIALVGLTDAVMLDAADLRWLGPLAIVGFGIVLVATAGGGKRSEAEHDADLAPAVEDDPREARPDG